MIDMEKSKKQLLDEIGKLRQQIKGYENKPLKRCEKTQLFQPSSDLYRILVEQAHEAILVIQNEKIRFVNHKAAEITGYSKKELRSCPFNKFIHPEDRELISTDDIHNSENETPFKHRTCRLIDKENNIRWVDAKLLATRWAGNSAIICYLIDITKRKNDEEGLRNSEMKYRQLIEAAPAGIYEVDMTNGKLISVNDIMCEHTGYTKEEFLKLKMWDLLREKSREKLLERYEKMLKGEPVSPEAEYEIIGKNNKVISFLAYTKIEYKNGQAFRAHTVAHDITDRKKMEAELSKAQKLESLGVLAGGIGHDFNNLLSGIVGNISLAKLEAERGEDIMESLDEALRVASKASALTRQLLVFSKGGAPVKKAASITDVLRESTAFTLRGSQVRCHFEIPERLWPVKVDVGQFSQVIHNLVINAMQAMSKGGDMSLKAQNVTLNKIDALPLIPGRYVVIKLQDRGKGIAQENLSKVFDPYFTTKIQGSGLGLTMSYTIIKRHNGHITVESKEGKGTTFFIYLPATEEIPEKETDKVNHALPGEGKILVMDDEVILRKVAERMLLELGYEVQCVQDGTEALELYEKAKRSGQSFDAVIMDLTIPGGMGGTETVKKLLAIDSKAIAVVSSGYSNDPIISNYQEYGFSGVVTKPYRIEELSWVMRDVLTDR
jgi:PAS domain S-box-containing protein